MVIHPDTVVATLKQSMTPEKRQGIGSIAKVDGTWYLHTPNERIGLELPSKGVALQEGTVRYVIINGTVSLTPIDAVSRHPCAVQGDVFMHSGPSPSAPSSPSLLPAVFQVMDIPEGLYLFDSAEEALSFVGKNGDCGVRDRMHDLLADGGIIAVKVECGGNGVSRAMLLSGADIRLTLAALQASFSSAALSSIPIDVWQCVLFDRSDLPFAPLRELDLLLQGGAPFPPLRAGSASAQHNALVQWLHAVTAIDRPGADIAACAPVASFPAMISDLEGVLQEVSRGIATPLPYLDVFTLNGTLEFPGSCSAAEIIPRTMKRLGFTLENSLASAASGQVRLSPEPDLKSLLLNMAMLLESNGALAKSAAQHDTMQSTSHAPRNATFDASYCIRLVERLIGLRGELAAGIRGELFNRADFSFDSQAKVRLKNDAAPLKPEPAPAIAGKGDSGANTIAEQAAALKTVINHIRETAALLPEYLQSTGEKIPAAWPLSAGQYARIAAAGADILSIVEKISAMLDEITEAAKTSPEKAAVQPDNAPSTRQPAFQPLQPLLRALYEAVDSVILLFSREALQRRFIDETGSRTVAEALERAIIRQSPSETGNDRTATALSQTTLGRTLSAIIDRFESLQLLARQVSTSQGTQQIIALPIKFGNTWAEINVRLLRRRSPRSSKKAPPGFSVDINVAPPALGALHAHIDYRRSRLLQLSIEFERNVARRWFRKHHDELRNVFYASGFTAVHLDFTSIRPAGGQSVHHGIRNGSGIVDLTV